MSPYLGKATAAARAALPFFHHTVMIELFSFVVVGLRWLVAAVLVDINTVTVACVCLCGWCVGIASVVGVWVYRCCGCCG